METAQAKKKNGIRFFGLLLPFTVVFISRTPNQSQWPGNATRGLASFYRVFLPSFHFVSTADVEKRKRWTVFPFYCGHQRACFVPSKIFKKNIFTEFPRCAIDVNQRWITMVEWMGYRVFTFYCSHQRLLLGNAAFTEFFSLFFLPSFQGARRYCVTAAIKTKSNEWATGFILSPPLTGLFFGGNDCYRVFFF